MKSLTLIPIGLVIVICALTGSARAQSPRDFFPYHAGDTAQLVYTEIFPYHAWYKTYVFAKDSVDQFGTTHLMFANGDGFTIDSMYNVYQGRGTSGTLLYKLNAAIGEIWLEDSSYDLSWKRRIKSVTNTIMFGRSTQQMLVEMASTTATDSTFSNRTLITFTLVAGFGIVQEHELEGDYYWGLSALSLGGIRYGRFAYFGAGVNDDKPSNNSITVFPNPASTSVTLKSGFGDVLKRVIVYDGMGGVVRDYNAIAKESITINVSDLPSGPLHAVIWSRDGSRMSVLFVIEK